METEARIELAKKQALAGNPALAISELTAWLRTVVDADARRNFAARAAGALFEGDKYEFLTRALLPAEKEHMLESLNAVPGLDDVREWQTAVATIGAAVPWTTETGGVWVATATCIDETTSMTVGGLFPFQLTYDIGQKHSFAVDFSREDARSAFEPAIRQALNYLCDHEFGSLDAAVVLNHYGFKAGADSRAFTARNVLDGPSLGLPMALAVLSAIMRRPLKPGYVATGKFHLFSSGRVGVVGRLREKFEAARRAGLKLIYADPNPDEDRLDWPDIRNRTDHAIGVATLADALAILVDDLPKARKDAVRAHERYWMPLDRRADWETKADADFYKDAVLVTAVGSKDPSGTGGTPGAVLAIAEKYRPKRVLLLHTPDPEYTKYAENVFSKLEALGCDPEYGIVESLTPDGTGTVDPTDFATVFGSFRKHVQNLLDRVDNPTDRVFLTNVTSGTPQMLMAMHLLVERHLLPDYRLQVVDPDFAQGGDRVRRVKMPKL